MRCELIGYAQSPTFGLDAGIDSRPCGGASPWASPLGIMGSLLHPACASAWISPPPLCPAQDLRYCVRGLLAGFKADHSSYRKAVLACDGWVWHEVAFEYPKQSQGEITEFVSRTAKAVQNSEDQGCEASESSVSLDAVQRCPKRRSSHSSVLPLRHASWRRCQ